MKKLPDLIVHDPNFGNTMDAHAGAVAEPPNSITNRDLHTYLNLFCNINTHSMHMQSG